MNIYSAGTLFVPSNAVEAGIHAADFSATVNAVAAMAHAQRSAARPRLRALSEELAKSGWGADDGLQHWWGKAIERSHQRAMSAALFLCETDEKRIISWDIAEDIMTLAPLLDPGARSGLARVAIENSSGSFFAVQALVASGLSVRPTSDRYILGLIGVPQRSGPRRPTLLQLIDADPALPAEVLLRVFEVQGDGDSNMSSIEKYSSSQIDSWAATFLELVRRGVYTRALLLEKTIGTLELDWPQFRAGWFSRFHATLAPTPDEMAPFALRYAGLCLSRIAPTVTLALSAMAALYAARKIAGSEVLQALAPALSSAVKAQVESALKLLDDVVKRGDCGGPAASAMAAAALAHASAEVHKKVIVRIRAWGLDDEARSALALYLPHVAASCRADIAALIGVAAPAAAAPSAPLRTVGQPLPALDPSRALARIAGVDDLVQRIAFVFENDAAVDDFESVIEGLARLAPSAKDALSPVNKRARKLAADSERPIPRALARLLVSIIDGTPIAMRGEADSVWDALCLRIADSAHFMALHPGEVPLDTATHRRGFIDPQVLVSRYAAHGADASPACQMRAVFRLATGDFGAARSAAKALPDSPFARAVRYALGDDIDLGRDNALFFAAARIRHPDRIDPAISPVAGVQRPDASVAATYSCTGMVPEEGYKLPYYGVIVVDAAAGSAAPAADHFDLYDSFWRAENAGLLLYGASLMPSNLDAFFASGAAEVASNRDWWEARWQDKAYFTMLLDPTVPMRPMACATLAFGLLGKEAGQGAMAIDALVASYREGRLNLPDLAAVLRATLASLYGKGARYAKSLAAASRAHPDMPAVVFALLLDAVCLPPGAPAKEVGPLLELMLELALANQLTLPRASGDALAKLQLGGKGKIAQRALLADCTGD